MVYEVQNCSSDCDYPCNKECGETWHECTVAAEYAGTYDVRMVDGECEFIRGVLRRHVRRKGEVQPQAKRHRSTIC